jgi:hypothetical protein
MSPVTTLRVGDGQVVARLEHADMNASRLVLVPDEAASGEVVVHLGSERRRCESPAPAAGLCRTQAA